MPYHKARALPDPAAHPGAAGTSKPAAGMSGDRDPVKCGLHLKLAICPHSSAIFGFLPHRGSFLPKPENPGVLLPPAILR